MGEKGWIFLPEEFQIIYVDISFPEGGAWFPALERGTDSLPMDRVWAGKRVILQWKNLKDDLRKVTNMNITSHKSCW